MRNTIIKITAICLSAFLFAGCSVFGNNQSGANDYVVFQIGEQQIKQSEVLPLIIGQVDVFNESFGGNLFDSAIDNFSISDTIYNRLKSRTALVFIAAAYAESCGYELTLEDSNAVVLAAEEFTNNVDNSLGLSESDLEMLFEKYRLAELGYYGSIDSQNIEISEDDGRVVKYSTINIYRLTDANAAYQKAVQAKYDLADGKDFATVAAQCSDTPATEVFAARGELTPVAEKIVFSLASGENSDIYATDNAYCITHCFTSKDPVLSEAKRKQLLQESINASYIQGLKDYLADYPLVWNDDAWDALLVDIEKYDIGVNFYKIYKQYFSELV